MRPHDASADDRESRLIYLKTVAKVRHIAWNRNQRAKVCHSGEGAEGEQSETVTNVVGCMIVNVPW